LLFSGKSRNKLVGIDIGTTSVKLVELSRAGRSIRVDHYALEPLAPGLIVEHQIKDIDQVSQSVQRVVARSGTKIKRAAVCVASTNVISKSITVQSGLGEEELESLVEVEADRVVPYALDDVNIDFVNTGKSSQSVDEDQIQLVVCRKNVVESLESVLEEAGLEAAAVDVDHLALARVNDFVSQGHVGGGQERTTALMDFGFNTSRLLVFHNNRIIYTRENPFGGRQLIDSISQKYGMPPPDAAHALRANELAKSFKSEVLKPFVKTLIQELLRTMQFFYSSSTHNRVDQLLVTGGCAQIGNIDNFIEKRIEIPTAILNPFAATRLGSRVDRDRFRRDIPSLGVAAGMALRGIE
jgi:type IV pilus assembly protein PilM